MGWMLDVGLLETYPQAARAAWPMAHGPWPMPTGRIRKAHSAEPHRALRIARVMRAASVHAQSS